MLFVLKQTLKFLRENRKLWLFPLFMFLFVLGGLLVLVEGSVVAPFIYALF
ncbi:MAG: DUF5989 family protein [Nitrospinota bacterium]|jgi:hypothetical protein